MSPRNLILLPVVGLVLAGCSGDADGSPSAPVSVSAVPTSSPSASPSLSPSPSVSVVDRFVVPQRSYSEEQLEAIATVEEFFVYYDRAMEDPNQPFQRLSELAEGEHLGMVTEEITLSGQAGLGLRGEPRYEVTQVDPLQDIDGEQWVRLYVCSDDRDVEVVELETGKVVGATDSPFMIIRLDLRHSDEWRIAVSASKKVSGCEE